MEQAGKVVRLRANPDRPRPGDADHVRGLGEVGDRFTGGLAQPLAQ